jgi:hypothetical protein
MRLKELVMGDPVEPDLRRHLTSIDRDDAICDHRHAATV